MSGLREQYLRALGLTPWVLRRRASADGIADEDAQVPTDAVIAQVATDPAMRQWAGSSTSEDRESLWEALAAEVRSCTRCALHRGRTQTVFGVGRRDARLLVIGEAPGAEEDRQGEPFVGRAGQLLTAMLTAIGLDRQQVYIANILKCRPPGNRDPQPEEAASCTPYLERQISLIRPHVILAVGRIAAQRLLQSDAPLGRLRGQVARYGAEGTPLVVSYHPAYLLRTPLAKAKAWEDLKKVRQLLADEAGPH